MEVASLLPLSYAPSTPFLSVGLPVKSGAFCVRLEAPLRKGLTAQRATDVFHGDKVFQPLMTDVASQMKRLSQIAGVLGKPLGLRARDKG